MKPVVVVFDSINNELTISIENTHLTFDHFLRGTNGCYQAVLPVHELERLIKNLVANITLEDNTSRRTNP